MSKNTEKRSFEEMLQRLDVIVRALEKGDTPLEESMALYTEGTELIRLCTARLNDAEQTVVRLQKGSDGAPLESPFPKESEI